MKIATFYDHILDISRQEKISVSAALDRARGYGVEALEISTENLKQGTKELKAQLQAADLQVSSICAYFDFGKDSDITPGLQMLQTAQELNCKYLLAIPGFFTEEDSPSQRESQLQRMEEAILRLSKAAANSGVTLIMEEYDSPLAPYCDIKGVRRFLDRVPDLGCAFDTGNFLYCEEDVLAAFEALKDRIVYVHVKDRRLTLPPEGGEKKTTVKGRDLYPSPVGEGVIQIREILHRLQRTGYDGTYTIEHYGSTQCDRYLKASIRWLRHALSSGPAFR